MKTLTVEQTYHAEIIFKGTANLRKKVTLYKKNDSGLALFRTQAANHYHDAVIAQITNRKVPIKTLKWLACWKDDLGIGKDITELFRSVADDF